MNAADYGPQPAALCACTVTDQSGVSPTTKLAVRVDPEKAWAKVPPPSLPLIVIWYRSIGLSPGTAAVQPATSVSPGTPSSETFATILKSRFV